MKLTKSQLKKIIQEELASVREAGEDVIGQLKTEPFSEAWGRDTSSDFAQAGEDARAKEVEANKRKLGEALLFHMGPDKTKMLLETLNAILEGVGSMDRIASIELAERKK